MLPELPKLYWFLALIRIVLVFIPQGGYIHPDEFFQSVEVQAGKALQIESYTPWEFNSTFPLRSVTIPYFTFGVLYRLLNFLQNILNFAILSPYLLIVGPRVLMCLFSFLVDASMYKICINNNEKYKSKLVVLASSYVTIVYATHTFLNSIELILFAILQYYVCESLSFSNMLIKKREYLNYRYDRSRNLIEKVKFHKLRLFLVGDSLRNCFQISTVTVMGFFNRPTFLGFALIPVFFWLYRGIGNKYVKPMNYHYRILALIICSIPALLLNVLVDSFYYGYVTWGELGMMKITINNFIFTPLNFIKYNIETSNLAKHGLHPRFLHVLINLPLLFNVLALFGFYGFLKATYNLIRSKHQLLPTVRSIRGLMMLSCVVPVSILSIFPHQEPRFLIPILIPLVYLHSSDFLPEKDHILMKFGQQQAKKVSSKSTPNIWPKLWFTINLILIVFYGFLHQGGVYKATEYLSQEMKVGVYKNEFYIFTSHIYPMPQSLFLQKSSDVLHYSRTTKFGYAKRYFLHEEGSTELDVILIDIRKTMEIVKESRQQYKLFLVIPTCLESRFNHIIDNTGSNFKRIRSFYPHISTEALSNLPEELFFIYSNFNLNDWQNSLYRLFHLFGLSVYQVVN